MAQLPPDVKQELMASLDVMSKVTDQLLASKPVYSVPMAFPSGTGCQALPVGKTVLDLVNGVALLPNGKRLQTIDFGIARSFHFFTDAIIQIELQLAGASSGFYEVNGAGEHAYSGVLFDSITIDAPSGANINMLLSKHSRAPIKQRSAPRTHVMRRFFKNTTFDDEATGGTLVPIKLTACKDETIANAFGAEVIQTKTLQSKTLYIDNSSEFNPDGDELRVVLEGQSVTDKTWFTELDVTVAQTQDIATTTRQSSQVRVRVERPGAPTDPTTHKPFIILYGQTSLRR